METNQVHILKIWRNKTKLKTDQILNNILDLIFQSGVMEKLVNKEIPDLNVNHVKSR